ncbi:DUF1294 domain-containing protein [Roseovarius sp. 2305UL8-3]|uniref:DUF1294 domain-containing protein n=1 Tax=Roseovarius conchicola TaxID=3121636 RepID=UPI00352738CE
MYPVKFLVLLVLAYGLAVNLMTALLFWLDKRRAILGGQRVPERRLLTLAAIGGSPAAQVARRRLRHKTHKQPFTNHMRRIINVQRTLLVTCAALLVIVLWQIWSA